MDPTSTRPVRGIVRRGLDLLRLSVMSGSPPEPDLQQLSAEELDARIAALRGEMRPLEQQLAELRSQRDVVETEIRRRGRSSRRVQRADIKDRMRSGTLPTVVELIAEGGEGALDAYVYNLKTGGEIRLGFPGARHQQIAFSDGKRTRQAATVEDGAALYAAGWFLGTPGRPGIRVHFPGTRQERLADPEEVFVRPDA